MDKLGIIPAAGKAVRWGGTMKELLPVSNGISFLGRVLASMFGVDAYLLITNQEKIRAHAEYLAEWPMLYTFQQGEGLWSAIKESFKLDAKMNYFAMPDTYYPGDIFDRMQGEDFNIGYFETDTPERFGIIQDGQIVDKPQLTGTFPAYGVISWSDKVVKFWIENKILNHTQAFNMAMKEFGYSVTKMEFYYDMASWLDYREFMRNVS